jgi:hypothetical protein
MLTMTLLTVACCCGAPAYLAKPMWDQYPASAALPADVAGLSLRDDGASTQTAARLKDQVVTNHLLTEDAFAGVYSDRAGKQVTIFGNTGFRFNPEQDADAEMTRLTPEYALSGIVPIETGTRGEYQRCGTGQAGKTNVVVCTWADHGSLGTALFTRLSVEDSAQLLARLRTEIISRH